MRALQQQAHTTTLLAWNPNSLNYRLGEVFRRHADVVCITESRQYKEEIRYTEQIAARAGWGLQAAPAKRTEGGGRSGGVTLLCKSGAPERIPLTASLQLQEKNGRLTVARVPAQGLNESIIVAGFYGFPDEPLRTIELLHELATHLAGWGNEKCAIMGDFNLDADEGWLDELLLTGNWYDAHAMTAHDQEPAPTSYCARKPKRIDYILLNHKCSRTVQEAEAIEDCDSYPHVPIYCSLNGSEKKASRRVQMPPAMKVRKTTNEQCRQDWLRSAAGRWNALIEQTIKDEDPDALVQTFSRKWEDYARHGLGMQVQGGRGRIAEVLTAVQPKTFWPGEYEEAKIQEITGLAKDLVYSTVMEKKGEQLAEITRALRAWKFPAGQRLQEDQIREHSSDEAKLYDWCKQLKQQASKEARALRKERWKEKLTKPDLAEVCASLRKPRMLPLTMVQQGEQFITDPELILDALDRQWAPILRAEEQEADWHALEQYLLPLRGEELQLPPLEAEQLHDIAKKMRRQSAPGADGWRPAEIRQMPREFFADLAHILNWLEARGCEWPLVLRRAWLAAIPKKKRTLEDIRPIAILPTIYRLWSGVRGRQLRDWLDHLQPFCQSAYRKGRGTEAEIGRLGMFYERAYLANEAVCAVSLDFSKAFDSVNHSILGAVLRALGMKERDWQLLTRSALALDKRWRLNGQWLGEAFRSGTGVAQGCSLSVGAFTAYLLPLMKKLEEDEQLIILNYADDLVIASKDPDLLQRAIDDVVAYAELTKLKLNVAKSSYWLYGKDVDHLPARIQVNQEWLYPQSKAEVLGADLPAVETPFEAKEGRSEERDREVRRRLNKLQTLPIGWSQKARATSTAILPCQDYAGWTRKINGNRHKGLRHHIAVTVHGKLANGPRAIEILLGGYSPIHLLDPRWTGAWRHLQLWSRVLSKEDDAWHLLYAAYHGRLKSRGPAARLAHYLKELAVTVDWETGMVSRGDLEASLMPDSLQQQEQQHRWRELFRTSEFSAMERRREDMQGLEGRLDRKALSKLQQGRTYVDAAILRMIHSGAVLSKERIARHKGHGEASCYCEEGDATFEHICWSCPWTERLWSAFGRHPDIRAQRCCALPLQGVSWREQKKLADHAVACWKTWTAQEAAHHGHDEEDKSQRIQAEPELVRADAAAQPVREEEERREEEEEEPLVHLRTPQDVRWETYATCPSLEIETHRRWVRCKQCRFTSSIADTKLLLKQHEQCNLPQRMKGQGSFPDSVPPHITFIPASGGSVLRFLCLACGAHEHSSQRATFLARHGECSERDLLREASFLG